MPKEAKAGEVIEGKYRLERELGAGGMGSVWLGTQLMVDRPVAVKLLHPEFIDQEDLQARFEVEAKAIGKLNHPNVITLYDFGYSRDLEAFYTVIEYIDGVSLDKRLGERMPLREVCDIIRMVALALDHAHHHGILHRDLKPENVMVARMTDGSQIAKVLDFGIARIVKGTYDTESPESQRITKAGEVFGTPAYMSPEQARSIRRLGPASDLYSLGIMLYELVDGRLPFFAKSAFDLLMLHVTKPVPPLRRTDVPRDLEEIIFMLLEKEPEHRIQSGKELALRLNRLNLPASNIEQMSYTSAEFPSPVMQATDRSMDGSDEVPTIVNPMQSPFSQSSDEIDTRPDDRRRVAPANPHVANADPKFALPTPTITSAPPYPGETRAPTVLMNGDTGAISASRDVQGTRMVVFGAAALVVVVLAALIYIVVSGSGGDEVQRDVYGRPIEQKSEHVPQPPPAPPSEPVAVAPNTDELPQQAAAPADAGADDAAKAPQGSAEAPAPPQEPAAPVEKPAPQPKPKGSTAPKPKPKPKPIPKFHPDP